MLGAIELWLLRPVAALGAVLVGTTLLLSAVGCSAPVKRNVTATSEEWRADGFTGRRLITRNFEIMTTARDEDFVAGLPRFVEAAHREYAALLPPRTEATSPLRIYVFGTRAEWSRFVADRFAARQSVYARIRSGGFTEGAVSVCFYTDRSSALATIAHEGWHQYTYLHGETSMPAWLNEGLACRFESFTWAGDEPRFTPRQNTFRINALREAVQRDLLLPLPSLAATNSAEVVGADNSIRTQTYYAQAWALVDFLMHGGSSRCRHGFDDLLAAITDGTYRARITAANVTGAGGADAPFAVFLGVSPTELEAEYRDHVIRLTGL